MMKKISWVYNILDGTAKKDSIYLQDNDPEKGFILFKDMKWNGMMDNLYLQGNDRLD